MRLALAIILIAAALVSLYVFTLHHSHWALVGALPVGLVPALLYEWAIVRQCD